MQNFTPLPALLGGLLIGISASVVLLAHGKVTGISGMLGGLLQRGGGDRGFRIAFLGGLLVAGVLLAAFMPNAIGAPVVSLPLTAVAGALVGFGTRLGSGCTSGHGVCGISRLSGRSIVSTVTFMLTGAISVFLVRHVMGGA